MTIKSFSDRPFSVYSSLLPPFDPSHCTRNLFEIFYLPEQHCYCVLSCFSCSCCCFCWYCYFCRCFSFKEANRKELDLKNGKNGDHLYHFFFVRVSTTLRLVAKPVRYSLCPEESKLAFAFFLQHWPGYPADESSPNAFIIDCIDRYFGFAGVAGIVLWCTTSAA